ncbi:hypothetical protein JOB18_006758 [Solea senegalensis]|uniref:Uncharacterized protein n=1 Tax=Solea senegalensis TaxID=28829 RepID=A0AAV6S451_SOLSE|nr:hypothetical protein JOB18_006758 [Solea senegalensis]
MEDTGFVTCWFKAQNTRSAETPLKPQTPETMDVRAHPETAFCFGQQTSEKEAIGFGTFWLLVQSPEHEKC